MASLQIFSSPAILPPAVPRLDNSFGAVLIGTFVGLTCVHALNLSAFGAHSTVPYRLYGIVVHQSYRYFSTRSNTSSVGRGRRRRRKEADERKLRRRGALAASRAPQNRSAFARVRCRWRRRREPNRGWLQRDARRRRESASPLNMHENA